MKVDEVTAYLAEVQQAGIFLLRDLQAEQLRNLLNVYCPHLLYTYALFVISDLVTRGGFPQLVLVPFNFDALYKKRLAEAAGNKPDGN
jgi:preprotein translocase subunit SecB